MHPNGQVSTADSCMRRDLAHNDCAACCVFVDIAKLAPSGFENTWNNNAGDFITRQSCMASCGEDSGRQTQCLRKPRHKNQCKRNTINRESSCVAVARFSAWALSEKATSTPDFQEHKVLTRPM